MKKRLMILAGSFAFLMLVAAPSVLAKGKPDKCTTIQSGELLASDVSTISTGYDNWGYNYQARLFNGMYCDSYRDAAWCQPYKDIKLSMKWNDAWLSNKDCDDDGLLDRHYGFDSYIGSGAWLTNHQSGEYYDLTGDWTVIVEYNGNQYVHNWSLLGGSGTGYTDSHTEQISFALTDSGDFDFDSKYENNYSWSGAGSINSDGSMSGTWTSSSNQSGTWYTVSGLATTCNWNYFTKIVAVPNDAKLIDDVWYSADGTEIGPVIWGEFATTQTVSNDSCSGEHGVQYLSPGGPGFGKWK